MEHDTPPQEKKEELKKNSRQDTIEHHVFEDEEQYTLIYNHSLQTIRDPIAHAIYHYLRSLPKDWKVIPKHLCNHFGIGRDLVRKKLKYLIEIGYMFYGQKKEGRQFGKGTYLFFKQPLTEERREELKKMFTKTGFQAPVVKAPADTSNTKYPELQNTKDTTTEAPESSAAPPDSLSSLFDKRRKYLKNVSDEEIAWIKQYYQESLLKTDILFPEAWITACVQEKWWAKAKDKTPDKIVRNQQIMRWIVKNIKHRDINEGYNYIEFVNGVNAASTEIRLDDHRFEGKCLEALRHRKLIGIHDSAPWMLNGKELNV